MIAEKELTDMQTQAFEHLDWLRNTAGLQWKDIAGRLKMKQPSVSRWSKRRVAPSPMACEKIERLYNEVRAERGIIEPDLTLD